MDFFIHLPKYIKYKLSFIIYFELYLQKMMTNIFTIYRTADFFTITFFLYSGYLYVPLKKIRGS